MLPRRLVLFHPLYPISRLQCIRHTPRLLYSLLSPHQCIRQQSSSLTSRVFLPPALRRREKRVRKTKPLPLNPSLAPRFRRRRRVIWYTLAFIASGCITYTALQPDNPVNYTFHGVIRCSRVIIALAHCVYDYRMTMRRKHDNEEEAAQAMNDCHLRCAQRSLRVFMKNGGIYIKIGQHLAALSYLIPIVCSLFPHKFSVCVLI